jgi:hypothetical protein
MSEVIELKNNYQERVGSLTFDEDPRRLSVRHTAAGFVISFPVVVSIRYVKREDDTPVINRLDGTLSTGFESDQSVELGRIELDREITTGWTKDGSGENTNQAYMDWRGTFEELAVFEKIREGRSPRFKVNLKGELRYLLNINHPRYKIRSEPDDIRFDYTSMREFGYAAEGWVERVLHGLGVSENVLVEIPLPNSPPAPWDEVWQSLVRARNSFKQGGSTGWQGCVVAVRLALEKWRDIEKPNTGPTDPKQRSKRERLDALRLSLHQCTHIWVHGSDDECSRDDALLMLSTLSALLAERKP